MRELRWREAERLVQQDLPRRVRDVILTTDHMRNFHQRIVDNDGEVVRRMSVCADDDRVADDISGEPQFAANGIHKGHVAALGYAEANRGVFASGYARLRLLGREPAACARIERR